MAELSRGIKIDGKDMQLLSNRKGFELYQIANAEGGDKGVVYGVLGNEVMFKLIATPDKEEVSFSVEDGNT